MDWSNGIEAVVRPLQKRKSFRDPHNEVEIKISALNDGHVKFWEEGVLKVDYLGPTDKNTGTARNVAPGGYARNRGPANWRYFADLYMDTSAARVLICPGSTWTSRGNCEMMIPSSWSPVSITAMVNQGQLPRNSIAFVYVVDGMGIPSAGHPVDVGQSQTDVTPPFMDHLSPSGTLSAGTTTTTVSVTTNEPATCAVASAAGVAHASKTPLTTTGGTNHSYSLSGLQNGQAYTRYISCQDAAGNISADELVFFSVANGDSTPSPDLSCSSSWNLR